MNENGDLKIPNLLLSYSGLFWFINNNINKVINISLIIVLVGLFIIIVFGPPMSMF